MKHVHLTTAAATACLLASLSAHAITIELTTSQSPFDPGIDNQGWWSPTRINNDSNHNYFTGTSAGDVLRSFFTFDTSLLPAGLGALQSAELVLRRFGNGSNEATETVGFFDVSTDAATLNNNAGTSATIFADLGTGTSYGSFDVDGAGTGVETFALNANAVTDITAALGGFFSIGGSLLSDDGNDAIFSGSGSADPQTLRLTFAGVGVPEPATVLLLGAGLAGFGAARRLPGVARR